MMTLSIVIPTLNEEKYLSFLLGSIKKQNFQDFEVIVADANSEDKTIEVAKKENCKIVLSGGRLPAKEKNKGALSAKGDVILFLDADIVLPDNFLRDSLREFKKRNLDIASFSLSTFSRITLSISPLSSVLDSSMALRSACFASRSSASLASLPSIS